MEAKPVKLTICMGSSCFARGNRLVLDAVQELSISKGLETRLELMGSRCEGQCRVGPNVRVDGELHQGVDAKKVLELLRQKLALD
jgi:NADH:ubiquinone oxidoreductase subunit E